MSIRMRGKFIIRRTPGGLLAVFGVVPPDCTDFGQISKDLEKGDVMVAGDVEISGGFVLTGSETYKKSITEVLMDGSQMAADNWKHRRPL